MYEAAPRAAVGEFSSSPGQRLRTRASICADILWRRAPRVSLIIHVIARGLDTLRTVVVGASSGLGRCIGVGLARRGARVALLARRRERLEDAAEEAGPGTLAIECDVTDAASCRSAIAEAAAGFGGIDALVYASGIGPLVRLVDTAAETWRRVFDTNVTGAALATAAAIPHLTAAAGTAVYLSSVMASLTPPWPGLGAYAVSKAALDKLVEAWRAEHPGIGFTRVVVGDCTGGDGDAAAEFSGGWDLELAAELFPLWLARNYMSGALIEVDELVTAVDAVLRSGASLSMPSVTVVPRPVDTFS
jgi:NAD(P)-dependent dehydrogenase (short-subunit alcohol dehydrogenase family)